MAAPQEQPEEPVLNVIDLVNLMLPCKSPGGRGGISAEWTVDMNQDIVDRGEIGVASLADRYFHMDPLSWTSFEV